MMRAPISAAACAVVLASAGGAFGQVTPFTEEAIGRGVNFFVPLHQGAGRGIAFADLDGDGDEDLLAAGGAGDVFGVWENDGTGNFINRSATSGIAAYSMASGLCVGDYDADGDPDVYLSRWGSANVLLRNNGGFTFTNVAAAAGVADGGAATGCAWGDFDGDGDLDLYLANMTSSAAPPPNALYRNNGNGTFTDVAVGHGVHNLGLSWQAAFFDYDRDGDADLYVNNDKGQFSENCARHNFMFRNDGPGMLVDATVETNTFICADAMGMAIGDFDGNGWLDIYISNTPAGNPLLLNQGDGTFVESSALAGVLSNAIGWGTVFFDFDNDADNDLYLCNENAPNRLYANMGYWPCTNLASAAGVRADEVTVRSFQCAVADVDLDGDQDLLVANGGDRLRLYINNEGQQRNWFRARILGVGANRNAYGAIADCRTGDLWQTREVLGAGGYKSHDELTVHFGLDGAEVVDELIVTWPGGATRTLTGYSANRHWRIYHENLLGDADLDGDMTSDDFFSFLDCFLGQSGAVTPGCEFADFDGDASFSSTDFFAFVARFLQQ